MKYYSKFYMLGLRMGLISTLLTVFNLGCLSSPAPQLNTQTTNPKPIFTYPIDLAATQDKILLSSPIATIPLSSSFSQPPLNTFTALTLEPSPDPYPSEILPSNIVWKMLEQVNIDRALYDLRQLTGETPICNDNGCYTISNRLTGSEGLDWAKEYVSTELANLGYTIYIQDWFRSGYADQNIIARKPGATHPEEEIYFVAHLDGVGSGGGQYPAADDNASGVVDILELARILSNYSFNRTVILFISTGEEQGTLGVKSYLDQLTPSELSAIKYVVNIDMVGYDTNQDGVMELWHGGHSPSIDLTTVMSQIIQAYQLDLVPVFVVGCG